MWQKFVFHPTWREPVIGLYIDFDLETIKIGLYFLEIWLEWGCFDE
jgi:hypothetical protein